MPAHPPRRPLPTAVEIGLLSTTGVVRTRAPQPVLPAHQECSEPGHGPFVRCGPAPVLHLPAPELAGALLAAVDGTLAVAELLDGGRCCSPIREPQEPPARAC